jgi:heme A synthase
MPKLSRLAYFSWFVLLYTLAVILWGAFVRATGSGAGCGNHWPLCNGEVIPRAEQVETIIEFTHRAMTGLLFPLVLIMVVGVFRKTPKGAIARTGANWSVFFLIIESLIGAGLVRFDLVADNASIARAFSIAVHLVNTFLLLAALTLTAWWTSGGGSFQIRDHGSISWLLGACLLGMIILGASGAVTALGDTLFPSASLATGFQQDLSPTAHFLIRLRLFHPLIAITVSLFTGLVGLALGLIPEKSPSEPYAKGLIVLIITQLGLGLLNIVLLAPIWLQLIHLLMSDLIWITLILFSAKTLTHRTTILEGGFQTTTSSASVI